MASIRRWIARRDMLADRGCPSAHRAWPYTINSQSNRLRVRNQTIYLRSVIHSTIKSFLRSYLSYSEPSSISCLGRHLRSSKTSRQDPRSSYLSQPGVWIPISSKPSTTKAWTVNLEYGINWVQHYNLLDFIIELDRKVSQRNGEVNKNHASVIFIN